MKSLLSISIFFAIYNTHVLASTEAVDFAEAIKKPHLHGKHSGSKWPWPWHWSPKLNGGLGSRPKAGSFPRPATSSPATAVPDTSPTDMDIDSGPQSVSELPEWERGPPPATMSTETAGTSSTTEVSTSTPSTTSEDDGEEEESSQVTTEDKPSTNSIENGTTCVRARLGCPSIPLTDILVFCNCS
jgi:hypothetical protein